MAMHRRSAGVGLARRRGRTVHDAPGSPATYQSILGALLVEMWHSQLGIATVSGNVDTWTGQIGGRVVQAPAAGQRPVYAADGGVFGGKSVVQCAIAGVLCLRGIGLTQIYATGTRPYTFTVGRFRGATPGAFATMADVGVNAVSSEADLRINVTNQIEVFVSGVGQATGGAATTPRHSYSQWLDGVNLNLSVDSGAPVTAATAGSIGHNVTAASFGSGAFAVTHPSDSSIALQICCAAKPSAAQIAALEALALVEFPA